MLGLDLSEIESRGGERDQHELSRTSLLKLAQSI